MSREGAVPLIVVGAGGHAKVVVDAALAARRFDILGVVDDWEAKRGALVLGVPVIGGLRILEAPEHRDCQLVVAIGNQECRERVARALQATDRTFATVIHPSAQIGVETEIGLGTVVLAGAVINSGASIGQHVIVNTRASIDHDCQIADFAHVAPGAALAGGVSVGCGAHIGIGACVIEGRAIGDRSIVGAGAVVLADVAEDVVVAGVPARVLRLRTETSGDD